LLGSELHQPLLNMRPQFRRFTQQKRLRRIRASNGAFAAISSNDGTRTAIHRPKEPASIEISADRISPSAAQDDDCARIAL
jgi:hypothetical protein